MRLLRDVGSVTLISVLAQISTLGAVFLLGRHLPKDVFGYVMLWVYSMNLVASAALLGLHNSILRSLPQERLAASRWGMLLRPLTVIAGCVSLLGAASFMLLYRASPLHAALLLAAGVGGGLSLLLATFLQIFRRFALAQLLSVLWRIALLLVTAGLVVSKHMHVTAVLCVVVSFLWIQVLLSWLFLRRHPAGSEPARLHPLIRPAMAFFALQLSALLTQRLDALFLPRLMDLSSLGTYSAVTSIALTGFQIVGVAVGQVLNPRFASGEVPETKPLVRWLLLGGGVAALLLIVLGSSLVEFVFGSRYGGNHTALFALVAFTGLFQVLYAIPSSRIGIRASQKILDAFVWWSFASVLVDVVLLFGLVPRWGLAGAAAATAMTWVFRTGVAWGVSRKP